MTEEIWKPLEGYDYPYEISNLGRLRSVDGRVTYGHDAGAAVNVTLRRNGKHITMRMKRLVAEAFIPNPEGKEFVCQIDGNQLNCQADNLRWCTRFEAYNKKKPPKPKKPKPKKVPKCPTNCVHNGHWDTDTRYCAYLFNTGTRRPCPAGPGCTEYVPKKNTWIGWSIKPNQERK